MTISGHMLRMAAATAKRGPTPFVKAGTFATGFDIWNSADMEWRSASARTNPGCVYGGLASSWLNCVIPESECAGMVIELSIYARSIIYSSTITLACTIGGTYHQLKRQDVTTGYMLVTGSIVHPGVEGGDFIPIITGAGYFDDWRIAATLPA
jgi:hypothetical protein